MLDGYNGKKPLILIRVSAKAFAYAVDLVNDMADGNLLGPEPGSGYTENIGGHILYAFRLRNGGIDVRDYLPDGHPALKARHNGWDGHTLVSHGWDMEAQNHG
jgi:hypothetical protein